MDIIDFCCVDMEASFVSPIQFHQHLGDHIGNP